MKSFGVGCFHFSLRENIKKNLSLKDYMGEIRRALSSIDTVSDIEMSYSDDENREIDGDTPHPKIFDGEDCHPAISHFKLQFKVYVPRRVQAELLGIDEDYVFTGSEYFQLYFRQEWHGPITYVECLGATTNSEPSEAVRIAREYLTKCFSRLETWLVFDLLGPSPFHCDFYVAKSTKPEWPEGRQFATIHTKRPGYDRIDFEYSPSLHEDDESAFEDLMEELADELAFFYELNRIEVKRLNAWAQVDETLHLILGFESKDSKKSWKERFIEKPRLLKQIFRDIGLFKGQEIYNRGTKARSYSSIYSSGKQTAYLKHFLDKEINDAQEFPVVETQELLKFFDQKSSKAFELMVIFVAAVMGGMIGALITVAFGK